MAVARQIYFELVQNVKRLLSENGSDPGNVASKLIKITSIKQKLFNQETEMLYIYIVTYVRFPCLSDVGAAVTIDSTGLLHFRSNATMKQTLQGNNLNRKRDYGYGVIDKREFFK
jgi:hypothetical protein